MQQLAGIQNTGSTIANTFIFLPPVSLLTSVYRKSKRGTRENGEICTEKKDNIHKTTSTSENIAFP